MRGRPRIGSVALYAAGAAIATGAFFCGVAALKPKMAAAPPSTPVRPPRPILGESGLALPIEAYFRRTKGRVPDSKDVFPTKLVWIESKGWVQGAAILDGRAVRTVDFRIRGENVAIESDETERIP